MFSFAHLIRASRTKTEYLFPLRSTLTFCFETHLSQMDIHHIWYASIKYFKIASCESTLCSIYTYSDHGFWRNVLYFQSMKTNLLIPFSKGPQFSAFQSCFSKHRFLLQAYLGWYKIHVSVPHCSELRKSSQFMLLCIFSNNMI